MPTKKLILNFYNKLFAGEPAIYKGKKIPLKKVKGLRRYDVGNILFIEQNPKAKTVWAKEAQKGKKIMWIVDTKWNKYLYRVVNGKIIKLKK